MRKQPDVSFGPKRPLRRGSDVETRAGFVSSPRAKRSLAIVAACVTIVVPVSVIPGRNDVATAMPVHEIEIHGGDPKYVAEDNFSGRVAVIEQEPWIAIATEGLSASERDRVIASVNESIDISKGSPEAVRFFDAMKKIDVLPHRSGDDPIESSRFMNSSDSTVSSVKVVIRPNTIGHFTAEPLDRAAAEDGRGSTGIVDMDVDVYLPVRDISGKFFLMPPWNVLFHELLHAGHFLGGALAPEAKTKYLAIILDPYKGPQGVTTKTDTIEIEEALTHGRPAAVAAVNQMYPPNEVRDSDGRRANSFELHADNVARPSSYLGPNDLPQTIQRVDDIRDARRLLWGITEMSVSQSMPAIDGHAPLVRALYNSLQEDLANPKIGVNDQPAMYRIPGPQRDVPLSYRLSPDAWEHAPPGFSVAPTKIEQPASDCNASATHLVSCKKKTSRAKSIPEEHAAAPKKKFTSKDLDLEAAQQLRKEVLNDEKFMSTLPARTNQPMSAADIETTHALVKAKIIALRGNGGAVSKGVGAGTIAVNLVTTIKALTDKHATPITKAEAIASLIPVVGPLVGLGEGIAAGDAKTIAVNAIALSAILIAQAVPAIGELIDAGLFIETVVEGVVNWWKTLNPEDKKGLEECAWELLPDRAIVDVFKAGGFGTPCRNALVDTGVTILNAVVSPLMGPTGPTTHPNRGGGMPGGDWY